MAPQALQTPPPSANEQHWHAPELQNAPVGQVAHAAPLMPHALAEGTVQAFPEQQPLGHEVGVHWQVPPTHCCPDAQIPPSPQAQAPFAQRLARMASQGTQLEPEIPQLVNEGVVHCRLLLQHPLGQDVGLHTQPLD